MAESTDWKQIIEKSKRSILVTIRNYTKHSLQRLQYSLDHGKWASIPQENIPPYSEVQFASVNRGPIHGTCGKVIYCLSKNPHIKFEITWENTFLDHRNAVCNVTGATERFQVIRTVNRRPHFEATFEIHPKTASLSPAHSLPLSKSSPQLTAQSPTKSPLHYPDSDNEDAPSSVSLVIDPHETDDKLWKDEQLESERSINITIRNDTEFGMTKSKQTLKEGIWSKMPPIYIPPNTVVEFGCRSTISRGNVCGDVNYLVDALNMSISFYFENMLIGEKSYRVNVPEQKLFVDITYDQEPNSNVIYTITSKSPSETSLNNNDENDDDEEDILPRQLTPRSLLPQINSTEYGSPKRIKSQMILQGSASNLLSSSSNVFRTNDLIKTAKTRVFGVPLRVIVERENTLTRVPIIVERLIDHLLSSGREEPLLFKRPGYSNEISILRSQFDYSSQVQIDFSSFSIHSCAHVFKMFLRELTDPVIPPSFVQQFISCSSHKLSKSIAHSFSQFVVKLPEENKRLLEAVTRFLYLLTKPSSKVELGSVATIFSRILCPDTPENSIETCVPIQRTFKLFIELYERIQWNSNQTDR